MTNNDMKPASSRESINKTAKRTRKMHNDAFKAKVALAAVREDKTLGELSSDFGVHSNMVSLWKQELVHNASKVFASPKQEKKKFEELELRLEKANSIIGEKELEIAYLKKNLRKLGLL